MKRSDMLSNISDIIENAFPGDCESYCMLVAKSILDMQEHDGMLPPDKRPASSQLTTKDWKIERDKWVQRTFAWEPEDE